MGDLHDRNGDNVVSGPIGYFSTEYECLEAMLLAYGPGRVFPPFVALVETVRGFAMAFESHMLHSRFKRLCVNVVEPSVIQLIRSGKLNLRELLIVGLFRIGVEVWRSEAEVLRLSELISEKTGIGVIRSRYNIPETGWSYMVEPSHTGRKIFSQDADFDNGE